MTERAREVVLAYPTELSQWGRERLAEPSMAAYLRRVHDRAATGEEWPVFLDVGCCGDTLDVTLRVASIDGGPTVGEDTAITFLERADRHGDAEGLEGGWRVQSRAGPG